MQSVIKPIMLLLDPFFKSKLKQNTIKANLDILYWAKKEFKKKPIVAIGGINNKTIKN